MKNTRFPFAVILASCLTLSANTQPLDAVNDSTALNLLATNGNVQVFDGVLKVADWAKFDYKSVLERAKKGDGAAVRELLDFHGTVDGADALNHSVTCLELIPVAGDRIFGGAVAFCKPTLKKLLKERLLQAQRRTKKTALRSNFAEWAPFTWGYLTDNPVVIPEPTAAPEPQAGKIRIGTVAPADSSAQRKQ
jgi:hypothetical protein